MLPQMQESLVMSLYFAMLDTRGMDQRRSRTSGGWRNFEVRACTWFGEISRFVERQRSLPLSTITRLVSWCISAYRENM